MTWSDSNSGMTGTAVCRGPVECVRIAATRFRSALILYWLSVYSVTQCDSSCL